MEASVAGAAEQALKEDLKVAEVRMTEEDALNNAENIVEEVEQCTDADKTTDMVTEVDKVKKACTVTGTARGSAWASAALVALTTSMGPAPCGRERVLRTRLV